MPTVYLGIGSNLGDRRAHIARALKCLEEQNIRVQKCSRLIETDPVGGPIGQPKFLNGVLAAETELPPTDLLQALKAIERKLGRIKTAPNGPRPIDLDILLYGSLKYQTAELTIPHPRMCERAFVMDPLKEINPALAESLAHAHH